jgi:hypothetical protein
MDGNGFACKGAKQNGDQGIEKTGIRETARSRA